MGYIGRCLHVASPTHTVIAPGGETNWARTDYYYNESWQCLEERAETVAGETTPADEDHVKVQYVWDLRYIDAPVLRWRDTGGDPDLDETLYYCNDANMNVTALVEPDGDVAERVVYDPYGKPKFYDGSWQNESYNSAYASEILYCGYRYDTETGLYHVRHRTYHPTLGRWLQRDPIGYAAGMDLYTYVRDRPTRLRDPFGTFDEGFNANGQHRGHGDFIGHADFNYNAEDTDYLTHPHVGGAPSPEDHHFRDMEDVEADMERAVSECDPGLFQREAHNGQDWFSHRKGLGYPDRTPQGSRVSNARKAQIAHAWWKHAPDDTSQRGPRALWGEAQGWTRGWLNRWYQNCCRYRGKWTRKDRVPGGPVCCDGVVLV